MNTAHTNGIFYSEEGTIVIYQHGIPRDISHLNEAGREQAITEFRNNTLMEKLRKLSPGNLGKVEKAVNRAARSSRDAKDVSVIGK